MLTGAVGAAADVYQLLGIEPLEVGQQVKLLCLGDLFRRNIAHLPSLPLARFLFSLYHSVGAGLDHVPQVLHVVGFHFVPFLVNVCQWVVGFQQRPDLGLRQFERRHFHHDVLSDGVRTSVVKDYIGRLGQKPSPVLCLGVHDPLVQFVPQFLACHGSSTPFSDSNSRGTFGLKISPAMYGSCCIRTKKMV